MHVGAVILIQKYGKALCARREKCAEDPSHETKCSSLAQQAGMSVTWSNSKMRCSAVAEATSPNQV